MDTSLKWLLVTAGVIVAIFAVLIIWLWWANRRDQIEIARATENISVLDRTSKVFNGLTETIKERRRVLKNMAEHLSAQRLAIQKEIDELEHKRAQINISIERADIEELERLIEGRKP